MATMKRRVDRLLSSQTAVGGRRPGAASRDRELDDGNLVHCSHSIRRLGRQKCSGQALLGDAGDDPDPSLFLRPASQGHEVQLCRGLLKVSNQPKRQASHSGYHHDVCVTTALPTLSSAGAGLPTRSWTRKGVFEFSFLRPA